MKVTDEHKGYLFVLLDMITFGLLPVFAHYFVATIDPLLFGGLATFMGSLPLILLLKFQHKEKDVFSSEFRQPLMIIASLTTIASILFFLGTKMTTGINTSLLMQLEPFYGTVLAAIFLGEVISRLQVLATTTMVTGAVIVVWQGMAGLNLGDLFISIMPLFFQISHLTAKKIIDKVSDANVIPCARLLYSGIFLSVIAILLNPRTLTQLLILNNLLAIVFFGLIFRSLDFILWYQGIKRVPLSKASSLLPLSVAISFFGSVLILGETATTNQFLGLALIFTGLVLLSYVYLKPRVALST